MTCSQGRKKAREACTGTSIIDRTLQLSENVHTRAQSDQKQCLSMPGASANSVVDSDDGADDASQDWSVHDMFNFEFE